MSFLLVCFIVGCLYVLLCVKSFLECILLHFRVQLNMAWKERSNRFKDQSILITGCTAGIGEAYAEYLALQGAKLTLVGRS